MLLCADLTTQKFLFLVVIMSRVCEGDAMIGTEEMALDHQVIQVYLCMDGTLYATDGD